MSSGEFKETAIACMFWIFRLYKLISVFFWNYYKYSKYKGHKFCFKCEICLKSSKMQNKKLTLK